LVATIATRKIVGFLPSIGLTLALPFSILSEVDVWLRLDESGSGEDATLVLLAMATDQDELVFNVGA
jgi:hypothetical protein